MSVKKLTKSKDDYLDLTSTSPHHIALLDPTSKSMSVLQYDPSRIVVPSPEG